MTDLHTLSTYVDIVLLAFAAEAAGLIAFHRLTGRGVGSADILPNLASGAALVLALRLSLADAPLPVVLACLMSSLAAHIVDIRRRWRR